MAKRPYSFYPGCSSRKGSSASNYLTSVESMCAELAIELNVVCRAIWDSRAIRSGTARRGDDRRRSWQSVWDQGSGSSERRIVLRPQLGLSVIGGMIVAVELSGVVIFEDTRELVEELEELSGGLVGELGG